MAKPSQIGTGTEISWSVPKEITDRRDITKTNIYRSKSVDTGYAIIDSLSWDDPKCPPKCYVDSTTGNGRNCYYVVSFANDTFESSYHLAFFAPRPSESFLVEQVRRAMPPILQATLNHEDYMHGIQMAIQIFNTYPPQTYFSIGNFPKSHGYFLIGLAQMLSLTSRYVVLSVRDFRYNEPGGVVMDVDRGDKVLKAVDLISKVYTQYLPLVKMDFSDELPMGMGTVQLPLGMGGMISKNILSILDIFTACGR